MQLTSGEIHFLDPDVAGALTIQRTYAKGSIVKPVLFGLSETTGFVLNYIGGIVPDQDIIANSVPQTWRIVADGSNSTYGLSGSASTIAGSHIVSINGVMQIPENDGGTLGAGTGITFGTGGGTGPASFRIVAGTGTATVGNRIEFIEPPLAGAEIVVMNHALTKPFEAIKETNLKSTGATEARNILDRLGDYVSVKDYGALGDGVADDTVAIQTAIDQSVTNADQNKKRIFFPSGTYIVTSPLLIKNSGNHLIGESNGSVGFMSGEGTDIVFRGTTGPVFKSNADDIFGSSYSLRYKFKMSDMRLTMDVQGGTAANTVMFDLSGFENSSFENMKLEGLPYSSTSDGQGLNNIGFKITGNNTHRIIDCAGADFTKFISIENSSAYRRTQNILIESCVCNSGESVSGNLDSPYTYGVFVDGGIIGSGAGTGSTGCENITVQNCSFLDCDFGIGIQGNNNNILLSQNNFGGLGYVETGTSCYGGITADGQTTNLVTIGNTGSLYGNTGAAFFSNDAFQNRVAIENGSVQGVNIPKVVALFAGSDGALIGGTGSGATGTNYNIDKVTRNGTGDYTIDFTTNLQTDNYSIQGFVGGTAGFIYGANRATDQSESLMRIHAHHVTYGLCDPEYISVTII